MDKKQLESFEKVLKHGGEEALKSFIEMEKEAKPNSANFLDGLQESKFFKDFFLRGFLEGVLWKEKHKDSRFII